MVFSFLVISLVTSMIVEAINSLFKLRARSLFVGIKRLVNDPHFDGLAKTLYEHALINPMFVGAVGGRTVSDVMSKAPSYIDPLQFAAALIEISGLAAANVSVPSSGTGPVTVLKKALDSKIPADENQKINFLISGIIQRTGGDLAQIKSEISQWFDTSMDRVGGAFKRWTQLASFVIALVLAVSVNVNSLRIAHGIWVQPTITGLLLAPRKVATTDDIDVALTLKALDKNLPVGWPDENHFLRLNNASGKRWHWFWQDESVWNMVIGWSITALAALFGAPFWFDILQTMVRLKGSGPSPSEKVNKTAAAA